MATLVTVHGTYAHYETGATNPSTPQWWQEQSEFDAHVRTLLDGDNGEVTLRAFRWSGENSELKRRQASDDLLALLRDLDSKGESYAVIGHSHGGSVISSALVESVARGKPLQGLKKWITVGTPFIEMKRELFLFTRLSLMQRMLFIASLMLFIMFAVYAGAELFGSSGNTGGPYRTERFVLSGIMMSLPFLIFYLVLRYLDNKSLYLYKKKWIRAAREAYGALWLPLCHQNDEAVQGLKFLPKVKLDIVDRNFAASAISMSALFFLPLAYVLVVTSPTVMVGIADFLRTKVYAVEDYDKMRTGEMEQIEQLRKQLGRLREITQTPQLDDGKMQEVREQQQTVRKALRDLREKVSETNPELLQYERAQRFKRRFLEQDGKPCEGGSLCGQGHNYAVNAKLLFHVVTDELASVIVSEEDSFSPLGRILRLAVPMVLVPLISGLVAILILSIMEFIAHRLSALASSWLNRVTLSEVKRTAFGNDTEGEIAIGASERPMWAQAQPAYLPDEIGDLIAQYTDHITSNSLAKFRRAITTLAFAEGETKADVLATYFTWKELIHSSYFDVPEFRKLVAHALSNTDGFKAKPAFAADPDYARTGAWLAVLEPKPIEVAALTSPVGAPATASA